MTENPEHERHLIRYVGSFAPVVIASAQGARLRTTTGQEILDFSSGQMCATLGHSHPRLVAAIRDAAERLIHLNSRYLAEEVVRLAARLAQLLPPTLQKVVLLSTGSESNEVALKLAKMHTGRFEVVGLARSFHGLTAGPASSTYVVGHKGYGPGVPGTYAIPAPYCYRCPLGLQPQTCEFACARLGFDLVDQQSVGELAVLIAEPIQSAGGVIEPPPGYWRTVKQLAEERGMLLIFDEAQTGLGRVGALFAFEQEGVTPDVLTLSKTLGGGIPLAATVCSDALEADVHHKGFHYLTSHVSDPLAAAVGLAVLDAIAEDGLVQRAAELGDYLRRQLLELQARHEVIGDVRGRGLLQGVELVRDRTSKASLGEAAVRINDRCLELGLGLDLLKRSGTTVWRVAPPLVVTRAEIDRAIAIMDTALRHA